MTRVLAQEINQLYAEVYSALANPVRIMILYELEESPITVGKLAASLAVRQSSPSRHLKELRERGMVMASRIGQAVEHSLKDRLVTQALDLLRAILKDDQSKRVKLAGTVLN